MTSSKGTAPTGDTPVFETLTVRPAGAVLFVEIAAPPMTIAQITGRVRAAGTRDAEMDLASMLGDG